MQALKEVSEEVGDSPVPLEEVREVIEEVVNPTTTEVLEEPEEATDQEEEISDETIVQSLIEDLHKKFQWEIDREELGSFKTLDDFYKYIGEIVEFNVEQAKPKHQEVLLLEKFLEEGKTIDDFYREVSSNYFDASRLDTTNQEHANYLIYRFYKDQGSSDKVIEKLLSTIEDDQERTEMATEAQKFFINKSNQYIQYQQQLEKQARQQQKAQFAEAEKLFKQTVENFDYKTVGINIDEAKKQYIIDNVITNDPTKLSNYDKMLQKDPTLRYKEIIFTLIFGSDFNKISEAGALAKLKEIAKANPQTSTGIKLSTNAQKKAVATAEQSTKELQKKLQQLRNKSN